MSANATQPVFRFAPSPNGYLHLGHAYSALLNVHLASRVNGRFLLRIEDIDIGRCRRNYELAIYEDLAWLGLRWEEPVRRQSEHFLQYRAPIIRLERLGLLYPCFCTRSDIIRASAALPGYKLDPDGSPLYPGTCRRQCGAEREARIRMGERHGLRIDMDRALALARTLSWSEIDGAGQARDIACHADQWGDVLVVRKDVPASYHLAVVVDDALQGVTDVVRGQDLFAATSIHRLLQYLLGLPVPRYRHHPLIYDFHHYKLAKSRGSQALRSLRAEGVTATDVWRRLGF
jgi:glutamyl-Q tRNA(Asp) synthetase